jgi:hypothetical protein
MADIPGGSILEHFAGVEDPRIERCEEHSLLNILTIAICAVICGADSWTDVEMFGQVRRSWFERFLDLSNGIPSHDTFGRVFSRLDAQQFQAGFLSWVRAVQAATKGEIVAVDGKYLRRSHEHGIGKEALHLVSAWACANHLVLGQRAVEEGGVRSQRCQSCCACWSCRAVLLRWMRSTVR